MFPELSKASSSHNKTLFSNYLYRGFRVTSAIILPAALGLAILAGPILSVLFKWGLFGTEDVKIASEILCISAAGLPFYAFSAFLVKVFHSKQNMTLPLQAAIISMSANLIFSLILMKSFWDSWIGMGECNRSNWSVFLLIFENRRIENWKDCKK